MSVRALLMNAGNRDYDQACAEIDRVATSPSS
jgi:hypothetical protein